MAHSDSRPWLSVLMPTFNGGRHLERALDSIAAQNDPDIEIIAVDDGSTDETVDILTSYAERLPLKIVRRPHSGNWTANTNDGLSLARGEYVSFLHQDDFWLDNRLRILKSLVSSSRPVLIVHPSWFVDVHGRRLGRWRCPLPAGQQPLCAEMVIERLLVQNFVSIPGVLCRSDAVQAVGGLDEQLWYTADWDLWLKLAASGETVYDPKPLSAFRVHALSQTVQRSVQLGDYRRQHETVLQRHWARWPADDKRKSAVLKTAQFSINVHTVLAARLHGLPAPVLPLARTFLALGPRGWWRFFRDSRIVERVVARAHLALTAQTAERGRPTPTAGTCTGSSHGRARNAGGSQC